LLCEFERAIASYICFLYLLLIFAHITRFSAIFFAFYLTARSPTIAIAFAMKALNMTLKEAYEQYVARAGLDHVKINDGFAKQLMDWDLAIHNEQRYLVSVPQFTLLSSFALCIVSSFLFWFIESVACCLIKY
jgi:hypothetical protein